MYHKKRKLKVQNGFFSAFFAFFLFQT